MSKVRSLPLSSDATTGGAGVYRMNFLIVPRFNMATLITMIEPLRIANYLAPQRLYDWNILSMDGVDIAASNGLGITATAPVNRSLRGETLFVLASWGAETYANRETISWLRRQSREGVQICCVELGCYILARAGLLAGNRAATHWSWAPGFQEQFVDVTVVEQLFTLDEKILTCAGGMAGIDLMLRLIADRHGEVMAGEVADQMLHSTQRPADAPQRRNLSRNPDQDLCTLPPTFRRAIALIEQTISEPLTVPQIAQKLGVSQRQLERQFHAAIGCTVVQYGTLVRLQHARVLLISTKLGVREIAAASGFNTLSHFAFAFRKCFGRKPSDYRQGWPKEDSAPSWPGTLAAFIDSLKARKQR